MGCTNSAADKIAAQTNALDPFAEIHQIAAVKRATHDAELARDAERKRQNAIAAAAWVNDAFENHVMPALKKELIGHSYAAVIVLHFRVQFDHQLSFEHADALEQLVRRLPFVPTDQRDKVKIYLYGTWSPDDQVLDCHVPVRMTGAI